MNRNLPNTNYVSGTILNAFHAFNLWILSTGKRSYSHPHFTCKKAGTERLCTLPSSPYHNEVELGFRPRQSSSRCSSLSRDDTHGQSRNLSSSGVPLAMQQSMAAALERLLSLQLSNIRITHKLTPDSGTPYSTALPSPSSQMQPKLTGFTGGRRKGWQMGLRDKPNQRKTVQFALTNPGATRVSENLVSQWVLCIFFLILKNSVCVFPPFFCTAMRSHLHKHPAS